MKASKQPITRRQFLDRGVRGAGVLAAGSAVAAVSEQMGWAAKSQTNPFAYDVGALSKTDPKLIRYEETGRFSCTNPEPRRIAIGGSEERVYIAAKNGVSVFDMAGGPVSELALSAPARCVAVGNDGTVYAGTQDHVEVFDRKGQHLASWDSPGKKTWLTGLATGANDVFAADAGNRVVLRYDKSGKLTGRIGEKNKERNVPGLIVPSAYLDVKLGSDGLLRVNNFGRHKVEGYTANGELEFSWGKPSAAIEGFCGCCNPVGLALLTDGRYVTCEKGLARVKVYSAEGAFDCVVAGPESFPENARAHALTDCTTGGLDAAVDGRGRIYVLDLVTGVVRVMAGKG
jgi:hypothetical protein